LFKTLRSQYDDVVKRINHLEATNVQLRQEAEKYRAERTSYKIQVEDETHSEVAEKEAQLMRAETDLARIRNARDELLADQQMRKAAQVQEKTASLKLQELADAREARIAALESETQRLRLQIEGSKSDDNVNDMPLEDLRAKYTSLERQYSMLNTELTSMQTAYTKFAPLATQKVAEFAAMEEKVARLTAEKSKADQKFFAAMKSKDARDAEVRSLRMQNSTTSGIVSQLKEAEKSSRSLVSNMDKQASETKEALNATMAKYRAIQQQLTESNILTEGLKNQVTELKGLSVSKDSTLASTTSALRQAETELAGLKQSLSDTKKSLDNWKNKSLGNSSSEYEMLRVCSASKFVDGARLTPFRHSHCAQYAVTISRTR
jgi:E3 ubiquitin-protein ligase BRE1